MFQRLDRYDYYLPVLAHLGEQEVNNSELFCDGSATDNEVFGYQERWAEYRYNPSRITGKFRSSAVDSLDSWHLSEEFGNHPTLNEDFIIDDPPVDRVVAVPSEPHWIFDSFFNIKHARVMPVYSVPGLQRM
jgi:hypothetical protein